MTLKVYAKSSQISEFLNFKFLKHGVKYDWCDISSGNGY